MSDFYAKLAEHYDHIFPAEDEIVSFLGHELRGKSRLADLACGTGTYTEKLADLGFTLTGIDLDEAMIESAKAKQHADSTTYIAADMVSGLSNFGRTFGGAYCIGNSLVHLDSLGQVSDALSAWNSILEEGGKLVVQIVNFDRFAVDREIDLPSIERDGFSFERRYLPATDGKVTFSTALRVPDDSSVYRNSIDLLIIKKGELTDLLQKSGFAPLHLYGGYSGQEHVKGESFLTVCVSEKSSG